MIQSLSRAFILLAHELFQAYVLLALFWTTAFGTWSGLLRPLTVALVVAAPVYVLLAWRRWHPDRLAWVAAALLHLMWLWLAIILVLALRDPWHMVTVPSMNGPGSTHYSHHPLLVYTLSLYLFAGVIIAFAPTDERATTRNWVFWLGPALIYFLIWQWLGAPPPFKE